MGKSSDDFLAFLEKSPSVYHAADEIAKRLIDAGFNVLKENEKWKLLPNEKYFLVRDGSLVAAFRTPKNKISSCILLASHIDSPCLKLKPCPETIHCGIGELNTEIYGSPLLHTWLDRDLKLSGKITFLNSKNKIESKTIDLPEFPVIIPSLALHLDRNIGEKGLMIQKQDHLRAIFSTRGKENPLEHALHASVSFKTLLSLDLFLVPKEPPSILGFEKEFVASHRLDNLTSAYASVEAITKAKSHPHHLQMAIFWDHEEIGSMSSRGADSIFTTHLLERIAFSFHLDKEDLFCILAKSLCLSGDIAHGFHPNFPEKYDPQNAPHLEKGIVLKFNANQKYATQSSTAAWVLNLAKKHKIPVQSFASRSDIPAGSTVGSMMSANTGIPTVDLGISCWAMHSIRETIAMKDEMYLCAFFQKALEEEIDL